MKDSVLVVAVVTLFCLALAGLVLFYVAFPHRGETPPPQTEWLVGAMSRAVEALPTLDAHEGRAAGPARAAEEPPARESRTA